MRTIWLTLGAGAIALGTAVLIERGVGWLAGRRGQRGWRR